jgi:hypothetical protein
MVKLLTSPFLLVTTLVWVLFTVSSNGFLAESDVSRQLLNRSDGAPSFLNFHGTILRVTAVAGGALVGTSGARLTDFLSME